MLLRIPFRALIQRKVESFNCGRTAENTWYDMDRPELHIMASPPFEGLGNAMTDAAEDGQRNVRMKGNSPMLNLLYVEDDPDIAHRVCELAERQNMNVRLVVTGEEGLRQASAGEFDLIILDRMLPDMNGLEIVRRLREAGVGTPVLMLSALGRSEHRVEGLESGVDDYIAKPFDPDELIARVRALHRRSTGQAHSAVILYGDLECHVKARAAYRDSRHIPLSPKEFELFKYFMEQAGEVVTREMLLRDVWKLNFDPQTNVVDVNVGRLRRKLENGFERPALETVWGTGYRLVEN